MDTENIYRSGTLVGGMDENQSINAPSYVESKNIENLTTIIHKSTGTVNSGTVASSVSDTIGFFLYKSIWYGNSFFFSVDVQNRDLGSGSR